MIIASTGSGSSIAPLEEGIYTGVCTKLIDLGMQLNEKYQKVSRRIMLGWDIAGETLELSDGSVVNRSMYREYSTSLHEKSMLRKDLQAWRGKAFTAEELAGFDMSNILGVPCQLQIIHAERNGSTYANISAIMAMPKGMAKPEGEFGKLLFDMDDRETFTAYDALPDWIKEKIKGADNYALSGVKAYAEEGQTGDDEYTDINLGNEENLPF